MNHIFFSDGNSKRIAWVIKNKDSLIKQSRDHPEIYLDKVTSQQAKYIAMHVGVFWCIGRFIIKNEDSITLMIDSPKMFEHLSEDLKDRDSFIEKRTNFYKDLIAQRELKVTYQLVETKKNLAKSLL